MAKYNSHKAGFTLIEVILFLAISSAVLVAILAGTSSTLARQRYNDSVQDLSSFLQSQFSGVIDTQNSMAADRGGRSKYAIYGKMIIFENSTVKVWDVVGKAVDSNDVALSGSTDEAIDALELMVTSDKDNPAATYNPQWGGTIEKTDSNDLVKATIVIVRSPINGVVHTYQYDKADAVEIPSDGCSELTDIDVKVCKFIPQTPSKNKFSHSFKSANDSYTLNLCLNTEDQVYGNRRRNIRISDTNTIDAIKLIPLDDEGANRCL